MQLKFTALSDDGTGTRWRSLFQRFWPAYREWYLRDGIAARPTYLECRDAMRRYMPQSVPLWEQLVDVAGGGDIAARFLSLYNPPQYLSACSQAVWPGEEPLLVRNYDYSQYAFEATALHSSWGNRTVLGSSDCLVGLVDGINDSGLALSLTFGGRRVVGSGFGMPLLLRHVLQHCENTPDAVRALCAIPTHMAYNVTVLDARRNAKTLHLSPDREPVVLNSPLATNHQEAVEWSAHARATATLEREQFLLRRLTAKREPDTDFIAAFLRPPLYSLHFARGFGTLYTAALRPRLGEMSYVWPDSQWRLSLRAFEDSTRVVTYLHERAR
jgi:predicted choloylglycine hydrolase